MSNIQHPLQAFAYCPHCGSAHFKEDGPRSKHCTECGFNFYLNPAAAVAALITNSNGELLLTKRAFEPKKGTLDLPGGFAEPGETMEEALKREIYEELGTDIINIDYFTSQPNRYPFGGLTVHTLDCFFTAQLPTDSKPKANDDVAAYTWIAAEKIDLQQIGLTSIREAVSKWIKQTTPPEAE